MGRNGKRVLCLVVLVIALAAALVACDMLQSVQSTASAEDGIGFDRAAFIAYVAEVLGPMEALLGEGDEFDYENFRFFTGTNLNGSDETVVIVPLTHDSVTVQKALLTEEEAPLAEMSPMPVCGFLPLEPCTCFRALENGVPYLCQVLSYEKAIFVDVNGEYVRDTTTFEWNRGAGEPEWYTYRGNVATHQFPCILFSANNN